MKKLFTIIALMTLALGFAACNDKWEPGDDIDGAHGGLSLKGLTVDVTNTDGTDARATYVLDDFTVTVIDKATGEQVGQTYIYKTMPDIVTLPVGEYYVNVTSGAVVKAAFDAPYFAGRSADFTITDGEITDAGNVVCTLANIKVTIKYTDELLAAAGADSKVNVVANDEGNLDFSLTETRSGYFQALEGSSTLVATFTGTINGYTENNIRRVYTGVKPGDHYIITFGLTQNPGMDDEYGDATIADGLYLDIAVEVENIDKNYDSPEENLDGSDRPGKEDPDTPVDPDDPIDPQPGDETFITFHSDTFDPFDAVYDLTDFTVDGKTAVVTITSKNPIENLLVTIDSPALPAGDLEGLGLTQTFDLAHPDKAVKTDGGTTDVTDGLKVLGLLGDEPILGQTQVTFDITEFMPMLSAIAQPGQLHKFVLTVKDNAAKSNTETLTIKS